ncbi:NUDIX pyrophosphatase [Candidatus Magnetomoraceae bacterium gMMP-15]
MKIKNSIECWIINKDTHKVLLLLCPETHKHRAYWQPITGGMEKNESLLQACLREVREETGIILQDNELKILIEGYAICLPNEKMELRKSVFIAEINACEVIISDEHIGYKWILPEDVSQCLLWESNKQTYKSILNYLK